MDLRVRILGCQKMGSVIPSIDTIRIVISRVRRPLIRLQKGEKAELTLCLLRPWRQRDSRVRKLHSRVYRECIFEKSTIYFIRSRLKWNGMHLMNRSCTRFSRFWTMPFLLYAEPVCTCLRRNQYHPELPVDKWEDMMSDVARQETISSSNSLLGFGPQQNKTLTSRSSFDRGRLPCYPILLEICHSPFCRW